MKPETDSEQRMEISNDVPAQARVDSVRGVEKRASAGCHAAVGVVLESDVSKARKLFAEELRRQRVALGMTDEAFVGRLSALSRLGKGQTTAMIRRIEGGEIEPTGSYLKAVGLEHWSVNPWVEMRRLAAEDPDWYRVMGVILHGFDDMTFDVDEQDYPVDEDGERVPLGGYTAGQVLDALRKAPHLVKSLGPEEAAVGMVIVPRGIKLPNGFWRFLDEMNVGDEIRVANVSATKLRGNAYNRVGKKWRIRIVSGTAERGTWSVKRLGPNNVDENSNQAEYETTVEKATAKINEEGV